MNSFGELKSNFLREMTLRGMLYQCTDTKTLDSTMENSKIRAYIGFDCTAPSLHAGSLIQIMILRWLQKFGHHPIVVIGDTTAKIGDPSGKNKSRSILSESDVEKNVIGITNIIRNLLEKNGEITILRNSQWLESLNYIDFLRNIGSHFSVNRMVEMETFKNRLSNEQNLSFLEFSYTLLQSYDFAFLKKEHNCSLQIGGSDQWGNITSGIDLGKKLGLGKLLGLTTPLFKNANGEKMGKTANGAIWLDETKLTPYDFWQYFRNVHDQDVEKYLYFFTEFTIEKIKKLTLEHANNINPLKKILATEITRICHGKESALKAETAATNFFGNNNTSLLPTKTLEKSDNLSIINILQQAGFANSNSEARRIIEGLGCKVDGTTITDIKHTLIVNSEKHEFVISFGKKKHIRFIIK